MKKAVLILGIALCLFSCSVDPIETETKSDDITPCGTVKNIVFTPQGDAFLYLEMDDDKTNDFTEYQIVDHSKSYKKGELVCDFDGLEKI